MLRVRIHILSAEKRVLNASSRHTKLTQINEREMLQHVQPTHWMMAADTEEDYRCFAVMLLQCARNRSCSALVDRFGCLQANEGAAREAGSYEKG